MDEKKIKNVLHANMKTLTDNDIVTERKAGRRSFLNKVGVLLFGATAVAIGLQPQTASSSSNSSDSDKKDKKIKDGKKDSDENRMADPHLTDNKATDKDDGDGIAVGDSDPDSDMRTWADKKSDSD